MEKTKIKIAIAEDEAYLLKSLSARIEKEANLELLAKCQSGFDIIRFIKEGGNPDIILMDVEMETYNSGVEAARQISNLAPNIIIIFLTVHEEDDIIFQAFSTAPTVDYIVKSLDYDLVIKKINDAFYGRINISPDISQKITSEFARMRRQQDSLTWFINILFMLTQSEKDLIRMLLSNMKVKEMAQERFVEVSTIKSQINSLLKKFRMNRTKDIVKYIKKLEMESLFIQDETKKVQNCKPKQYTIK